MDTNKILNRRGEEHLKANHRIRKKESKNLPERMVKDKGTKMIKKSVMKL